MKHFALQAAFYILANIALAFRAELQTVGVVVGLMVGVPFVGLTWEIARHLDSPLDSP